MITYLRLFTLVFTFAFAFSALPQPTPPPALQEVEAKGTGITEDEAFKQAVVDAVRQAVGTLVTSENVVKNDKLIKDEILTFSNGFVEKVIKKETRNLDGVWEMKLTCMVRKGQLYDTLQLAKILPIAKIDGVSIAAKVASELERIRVAKLVVIDCFDRFLVDYLSCYEVTSAEPILKKAGNEKTLLEFPGKITINKSNWNRATNNLISTLAAAGLLETEILNKSLGELAYGRFEATLLTLIHLTGDLNKMYISNKPIIADALPVFYALANNKRELHQFQPVFPTVIDRVLLDSENEFSIDNFLLPKMKSVSLHLIYRVAAFHDRPTWLTGTSPLYLKRIASGPFVKVTGFGRGYNHRVVIREDGNLHDFLLLKDSSSIEKNFVWIQGNAITPQ